MAKTLVALQDVLVQYGTVPVLQVPTLTLPQGDILAIIGPNGAGKSTLLRVIGLLQRPTRGAISFHGRPVTRGQAFALRRRMASVFQEPLLLNASVYDNAALGLKLRGMDRHTTQQRVSYWLERLGIAHLSQRTARSLSGGEAQRTSLVRALAVEPDLLLLDEPFAALDPPSREALLLDLERILRETRMTTVFVTHDRHEALTLGDHVAVLFDGTVVQTGTPWEVFSRPLTAAVARFVGADITLPGTVLATAQGITHVTTPAGSIEVPAELPPGTGLTLCLRPEDITLHRAAQPPSLSPAWNLLTGTVVALTPWGTQMRVTIDCGAPLTALITRGVLAELALLPGCPVLVTFKASAVHVIRQQHLASSSQAMPYNDV